MTKTYTICLNCGCVQVRSDIRVFLEDRPYIFLDQKMMCPKCHVSSRHITTKNLKKLKSAVSNSQNKTDQKIKSLIRG